MLMWSKGCLLTLVLLYFLRQGLNVTQCMYFSSLRLLLDAPNQSGLSSSSTSTLSLYTTYKLWQGKKISMIYLRNYNTTQNKNPEWWREWVWVAPEAHMFESFFPSCWNCLGNIRKLEEVGHRVSLCQKSLIIPRVLSELLFWQHTCLPATIRPSAMMMWW